MSTWSISEALTDPVIRQPIAFRSEFRFSLRDIPIEITVRLYNPIHSTAVVIRQSHTIVVPRLDPQTQADCVEQTQEGEALQTVVSLFACTYNAAVEKGLTPDVSWLRANPDFR